jgi:hypothetical protein
MKNNSLSFVFSRLGSIKLSLVSKPRQLFESKVGQNDDDIQQKLYNFFCVKNRYVVVEKESIIPYYFFL